MAVVAGAMVGALWTLLLVRAWRARRVWQTKVARSASVGPDLVRGVLRGAAGSTSEAPLATTLEAEPDDSALPRAVVNLRAAEVYVVTEDGRQVELRGALRVLAGASPRYARGAVPEQLTDEELAHAREQVQWLHRAGAQQRQVHHATLWRLRGGERVVVRGQLRRTASDLESAPRLAQERWTLSGAGDELALHAAAPAMARPPFPLLVAACWLVFAGAVAFVATEKLGARAQARCYALYEDTASATSARVREGLAPVAAPALDNTHACVLATAARKQRPFYLERLVEVLRWSAARDEHHLATMLAVSELVDDCDLRFELLRQAQRYPLLEEHARRCRAPRVLAEALEAQGRYQEAADLEAPAELELPALPSARTLALAGRFSQAAARMGTALDGEALCTATLLRHWGGEAEAEAKLRALASDPSCAPHLAALEGAALSPPPFRPTRLAQTLYDATAQAPLSLQPERVLLTEGLPAGVALGIWVSLSARLPAEPAARARALRERAVHKVLAGRTAAVPVLAAEARTLAPPPPGPASALESLAQVFAGKVPSEPAHPNVDELPDALRAELVDEDLTPLKLRAGTAERPRPKAPYDYRNALLEAQRGAGQALFRYLFWHRSTYQWHASDVLAVWPHVRTGHAELRQAIEWWPGKRQGVDALEPASLAVHAALRRDVLRVLGAEREAKVWAEVFDRLDGVLSDPRKLFAVLAL